MNSESLILNQNKYLEIPCNVKQNISIPQLSLKEKYKKQIFFYILNSNAMLILFKKQESNSINSENITNTN